MSHARSSKSFRIISIVLLFIVGLNALAAGYSFMVEPSGKDIGLSIDYLKYSPFSDFFIPGLVLFLANGVLSIVTAVWAIRQWVFYRQLLVIQGCILLGWIMIQVVMVNDFNLLHFICGSIGIVLIISGRVLLQELSSGNSYRA